MRILIPLLLLFPFQAFSAGKIINADIAPAGTANIARNKMASGTNYAWCVNSSAGVMTEAVVTGSRAVATDANGAPVASATTATELGYVSGVTSALQTQLNGKQASISTSTAPANQFCTGFTAPNTFNYAQPASSNLSDSANIDLLNTAQTFTAAKINSVAGASSTPAMLYSGAPYAAGNATTNRPQWLMEWGSPTANTWNPNGTAIGVNSASGFTGKLLDLKINGSSVFSVDYGNGTSANQGSGVFFRNLNDNAQSFNICGQTGTVQASANCLSFYQSNAGTFALYSLAAAQGIYKIFNTNNTYATFAVGGATAASGYTYQMIVQNQAAAAYNAAVTMAVRAASGQTGDLQRWESNTPATLAKVDVNGKGFFANLNSAGITVAGLGRWDASGNLVSSSELSGDVTTSGSNVTTIANGAVTNAKLANSSVTVNGTPCTLGSSCSPSATPTIASYSGTMVGAGGGWTNGSSVSYADFAAATTSNTLTQIVSNNITCTAKTDKTPAIDCTLPATGYYMVCASGTGTSNGSNAAYFRLTDNAGTPVIINGGQEANLATTQGGPFSLCGMYNAASTSVTFKLQGAATAGNASVLQDTLRPITWMVKQ